MTRLTAVQARAAAAAYGWQVMSQDQSGFLAINGEWRLNVVFEDDGTFRCAQVARGVNGMQEAVREDAVVGRFAQHGRPVSGGETNA